MSTVLLLTASAQSSEFLKSQLEQSGYRVFVCEQFDAARDLLDNVQCHAFLFDLNILGDSFSSFYQWIGESPSLVVVPRIFLAGPAEASVGEVLYKRGDGLVLNKPVQINELIGALRQVAPQDQSLGPGNAPTGSYTPGPPGTSPSNSFASLSGGEDSSTRILNSLLGRQIGSVVIDKEIGRGGMGAVFVGHQTSLDRKVAIKVMLPGLVGDNTAIERFRREALAIARLKSPHIVQVFDAGMTPDQIFYIVMEFLEGETLTDHLKRHKQYPLPFALHVAGQAAQGLHVAHQAGLIHRDIKPSNLMINASNHITLTDFGLVRGFEDNDEEHQLTQARALLGTPAYLSPEQASAQPVDARSDIYSLGIVLYQLIVGKRPFVADNMLSLLMKQHTEPLPDPRKNVPDLPEPVVQMLYSMTAKAPNQRYPDCASLYQDIMSILSQLGGHSVATGLAPITSPPGYSVSVTNTPSLSSNPLMLGSSISSSQLSGAVIPDGNVLPVEFVKQLQLELAKLIGPIAKVTVKKEAQAMGYSRKQFPFDKAEEWISRISNHLDESQREAFQQTATNLYMALKE